jgi:hypothetical protein
LSAAQLFPEVIDASNLVAKPTSPIFLPVAIEGQMDNVGTAIVGTLYAVKTLSDAVTLFGPAATLTLLIGEVLKRGSSPVIAGASKKGSAPLLAERQSVWDAMSSDPNIRIRLTDSTTQADLVALGTSCTQAELAQHKQFAIAGMASGTAKAALLTASTAMAGKRMVFVAPGVYDEGGVLRSGSFAAACVAAEVSKNPDPSNDLDLWTIPYLTAIELDSLGFPIFREKIVTGALTNDFEDLLQGGVSPLMPTATPGGAQTSHLRTTYVTDGSYDALSTRIIVDQIFVDVRDYVTAMGYLRRPNNDATRQAIASGVSALLLDRQDWIQAVTQPDGTKGFNVSVTPSNDQRQVIVGYGGQVVRGIQTIKVAAQLTIPV